jgi:hypothetical protein
MGNFSKMEAWETGKTRAADNPRTPFRRGNIHTLLAKGI